MNLSKNYVKGNLEIFPMLLRLVSVDQRVSSLVENLLEELCNEIKHYFPSLSTRV
jgi:hypothetical protein